MSTVQTVLITIGGILLVVLLIKLFPDLQRYLKMKSM
jgi:hypothetical protein